MSTSPAQRATFREIFAVPEFRVLWTSYVLSAGGDRVALVALALVIYDRTRSPLLAAVAYAAGTVPYVLGALFLSGVADRFPRREVMVTCDVIRAALVAVMLVPGMPLGALIALLYAVTAIQPPFDAARSAILRDIVQGERYALAAATLQSTFRVVIVAGAAVGGLTVALLGARPALGFDAATFALSALLIQFGMHARPAAAKSGRNALLQLGGGIRVVFGDRALRILLMLGWLAACYEIPGGIAAPYAASLGGGPVAAGLLIAAGQIGAAVMTPVFTRRIGPLTRLRWMGPMAVCACGTLAATVFRPGLAVSMAIFALSGAFVMYQIAANTAFVERLPNERRAQAFGLANAGLVVGQGAAFALAGAAAEVVPPSTVIALGGGLGALVACGLALRWRRMSPAVGRHSARHLGRQASLARQTPVHAARSRLSVRGQGSGVTGMISAQVQVSRMMISPLRVFCVIFAETFSLQCQKVLRTVFPPRLSQQALWAQRPLHFLWRGIFSRAIAGYALLSPALSRHVRESRCNSYLDRDRWVMVAIRS